MFKVFTIKTCTLIALRSLLSCALLIFLDAILDFDTNIIIIAIVTVLGTTAGTFLAKINFRTISLICIFIATGILLRVTYFLLDITFAPTDNIFLIYNLYQHTILLYIFFLLSSFTTFIFWNHKKYFSLEFIFLLLSIIALFSQHRNYRFDLLRYINDISWNTGYSQIAVLTIISSIVFASAFLYLYIINSLPIENRKGSKSIINTKSSNFYNFKNLIIIVCISIFLSLLSREVYKYHLSNSESLLQNGVGSNADEGLSPLDFKSALGSSNQPAAVVRFNNDYLKNPSSPMLYLRESALSQISKNKIVLASNKFDKDISRSSPFETYIRTEPLSKNLREKLKYSIYLLGNHKLAFGVDYPISIYPVKIPKNKKKFKAGYTAASLAPIYNKNLLPRSDVFDDEWSEKERKHYLAKHNDKRYQELAEKLTKEITNPVEKVKAIIKYLNKNAIYTLAPNHEQSKNIDPTGQFLFGDLRGYCVHFAHASVYMFRALGIPSRIGTGYLTDLSQAKDGHILLRMSDRHAWAEIYINNIGWVPFDTEPEQVESHAETPVDQNVLDELIDLIGTDEEIITDELLKNEIDEDSNLQFIGIEFLRKLALIVILLFLLIYLRKLYLYLSWKLTSNKNKKIKKLYIATLATLEDIGFSKERGETKEEFLLRAKESHNISYKEFLNSLNIAIYKDKTSDIKLLDYASFISNLNYKQKILLVINPASVLKGVGIWKF